MPAEVSTCMHLPATVQRQGETPREIESEYSIPLQG